MGVLKWDKSYSVNVEIIDTEHKKIIEMANEYYTVYMATKSKGVKKAALGELLDRLVEYSMFHLAHEEEYFDKFEYEKALEHKEKHKDFRKTVFGMRERFDNSEEVYSMEVTTFIKEWLLKHIVAEDRKYTECFRANGLI